MKNIVIAALIIGGLFFGAIALFNNSGKTDQSQQLTGITPQITQGLLGATAEPLQPQTSTTPISPTLSLAAISPTPGTQTVNTAPKKATISTSKGDIVLTLYPDKAPKTVENFAKKAASNFYKNLIFHRVEEWVVQGGDPLGNGTGGGKMATELNDKSFVKGSLGVARGGDIQVSNDAQFFIVKSDATWLDKQYTNFGMVESGMDVVEKIQIGDKILGISVE